ACDVVVFFMVLLSFRFDHPEPTAQGKQRHPSGKLQHQPGHPPWQSLPIFLCCDWGGFWRTWAVFPEADIQITAGGPVSFTRHDLKDAVKLSFCAV
ncbi:hypothetical protein AAFO90_07710, partial [Phaeobacter sp. CAU 1743]|uniref:hypothetical protein n=1 Tax=Phaeobacter sp. CAU 1743 TaxID=3140367 RepID=UPI00325AA17A